MGRQPAAWLTGAVLAALVMVAVQARACQGGPPRTRGIPVCPDHALANVLTADALQCWLEARGGPWRILSHDSAHGAAVLDISAADPRDAAEIAGLVVASIGARFDEILVYVRADEAASGPALTTRVRWTRRHGMEQPWTFERSPTPGP